MTPNVREQLQRMRDLETRVGRPIFDRDPFVKFVPYLLVPPELAWTAASRCDPRAARRIALVAYGRDPLGHTGWLSLATLAAHSLLHCRGICAWAIDLFVGKPPTLGRDLPIADLFAATPGPALAQLTERGVSVTCIPGLAAPGEAYRAMPAGLEVVLRLDADAGALPGALAHPCFGFRQALGHSGLNARHTGRDAWAQLTHPLGRMSQWPPEMRVGGDAWTAAMVRVGGAALDVRMTASEARGSMSQVPWLSEGLSYLTGARIGDFVRLRDALLHAGLVPDWDEETVKLALVALLGLRAEAAHIPVLEHHEYGPTTADVAVVNFRNVRSLGPAVRALLDGGRWEPGQFSYLRNFSADVVRRATTLPAVGTA